jgi:hypothetical protein
MDLGINFDFFLVFLNLYSNPYPKYKIFFFVFWIIQFEICKRLEKNLNPNPNPNTQQIENPNPDLNLWVLLGAYVWV